MRYNHLLMSCAASALAAFGAANAQSTGETGGDTASGRVDQVVVTAQRRSENLQTVPISLHVLTGESARQRGVDGLTDLSTVVPGMHFNTSTNAGLVFLRGVGLGTGTAGAEGAVAFYMDDVYISSVSGNMFGLSNIDRVEVLLGPQGTLFGRNAAAGVVHVVTKTPGSDPQFDASMTFGNFETIRAEAYGTGEVAENLSTNLAVSFRDQNKGWGRNLALDEDVFVSESTSIRNKWLWEPGEDTSVTLGVFYNNSTDQGGVAARLLPGSLGADGETTAPADFYDVNQNLRSEYGNKAWIAHLNLTHDFGWATLKNITAYQNNRNVMYGHDSDNTPATISHLSPVRIFSRTWTQELQLLSPQGSRLDWILGAFYLRNSSGYDPARVLTAGHPVFGDYFDINATVTTDSYAAFGQASYNILPQLRVTLGGRYTEDRKHVFGENTAESGVVFAAGDQKDSWSKFTYRAALDYQLTDNIMAYVSASRGFKAGFLSPAGPADPGVRPEVLDAIESGVKTELFDNRLRLNVSAFQYDYQDMQVRTITPESLVVFVNAAESKIKGVDVSFQAVVTDRLRFVGAFEYLDTKFKDFTNAPATQRNPAGGNITVPTDLTGERLFIAPEFSASLGATYSMPLPNNAELLWAANYQYNDGFIWDPEVDNRAAQDSYNVVNLSAQYTPPSGRWALRLWGKNITDTEYNAFVVTTPTGGDYGTPAAPATYGATIDVHF